MAFGIVRDDEWIKLQVTQSICAPDSKISGLWLAFRTLNPKPYKYVSRLGLSELKVDRERFFGPSPGQWL